MRVEAVLFDLDGTIVEFRLRGGEAKQSILDEFRARGLVLDGITSSASLQTIIDRASQELEASSVDSYGEAWRAAISIMEAYEDEAFRLAKPRSGMDDLIRKVKGMKLKVGVVTNNSRKYASIWLANLRLSSTLDVVVTRDDVKRLKPRPESLMLALDRLGCGSERVVFVGDSVFDYQAAKTIGIKFIAFLGGVHSEQLLMDSSIDLKARSSQQLIAIIARLKGLAAPQSHELGAG